MSNPRIDEGLPLSPTLHRVGVAYNEPAEGHYRIRLVAAHERSPGWLNGTAASLDTIANCWPTRFRVGRDAIRKKLAAADQLSVVEKIGASSVEVIAFSAVSRSTTLPRTRLSARYIHGTITHPSEGGPRKFGQLMNEFGDRTDLELLHTQNADMARSLSARNEVTFPLHRPNRRLRDELHADIIDLMRAIGRSTVFCPETGISAGIYPGCLYDRWPIPGNEKVASFNALADPTCGVLVIGFRSASTAGAWMEAVGAP